MTSKALLIALALAATAVAQTPPWLPDLGNHHYRNPVLYFDYPDPDAIRVADKFYLTASSFNAVQGLPILESHDLVNWRLIAYAIPRLVPDDHYSVPRRGDGVRGPALRYHAAQYYIYYADPDFGIYAITSDEIDGPWTNPVLVEEGKGLADPCPLWDEDGKVYLVHGFSRDRGPEAKRLVVEELSADGMKVIGKPKSVVDTASLPGWTAIGNPKFYKKDGWYYLFVPASPLAHGDAQAVFRSMSVYGPYESRIVMDEPVGSTRTTQPGAWVETEGGASWFLHARGSGVFGQVVDLEPMQWKQGWPTIGVDSAGSGKGRAVKEHVSPMVKEPDEPFAPLTSDDFSDVPGPQWQWESNPGLDWSLGGSGAHGLLLKAVGLKGPNLASAGNLLLQKFAGPSFVATTQLNFTRSREGEEAGLIVYGRSYAWIGLRRGRDGITIVRATCRDADAGTQESVVSVAADDGPEIDEVTLRVKVSSEAVCSFEWSPDGRQFRPLGESFKVDASPWTGAKMGLFAASIDGVDRGKDANFGWFRVGPVIP